MIKISKKNNIKYFRKEAGYTQSQLAEKANLSRSYLGDIENERYNPSIDTLRSIASSLNVSLQKLLEDPTEEDDLNPKSKQIIDSLARAKDLDDSDYDHIATHVEALIRYARSKKKDDS
ncbi:helix-turn-helix transcriptional regulator [Halobacillus seohaensis]|uniref:Helix-turn-helix transcriptional regulator n=1 Tax=Halobacillus seohaensis TaxID=447421 RepID=A0ABW2EIQ9_9BACI